MYSASEVAHFYSSAYAQVHMNKINLLKNVFLIESQDKYLFLILK